MVGDVLERDVLLSALLEERLDPLRAHARMLPPSHRVQTEDGSCGSRPPW
jgi:hypothetical protein